MMKKVKSLISLISALAVITGMVISVPVYAENTGEKSNGAKLTRALGGYNDYLTSIENVDYPNLSISVDIASAVLESGAKLSDTEAEGKALFFSSEEAKAVLNFDVAESGFYNIEFVYKAVAKENNIAAVEADLSFDGKAYDWLNGIKLERLWTDDGDITSDKNGNDVAPAQKEYEAWNSAVLHDSQLSTDNPLYYYLESGSHSLEIKSARGEFYLKKINIFNKAEADYYAEAIKQYPVKASPDDFLNIVEAEDYLYKSSNGIIPENDLSNAATSPNDPVHTRLNYISGSKFKEAGSFVEWEFEVPSDGLYCIDMRVRQNYNSGLSSVRSLTIDGELPFKECEALSFEYDGNWYIKKLGTETPYKFYLTKGKHNIRLTVSKGALADTVSKAEELIYRLNDLYSNVVMVVGVNPDKYRDYKIKEEIPDIEKTVNDLYNELVSIKIKVESESDGKSGSASATLHTMLNLLSNVKKNPDKLCLELDDLRNNTESFAAWVNNLDEQPLDIDYIRVYAPNRELSSGKVSLFKQMTFEIKRLLNTFTEAYDTFGGDKKQLTVWVSTGMDQMKVIKRLIDNDYTQSNDTEIKLAMTTDITGAVLAAAGPDVCLYLDSEFPVNFASRGVLADLSEFDGFDDIAKYHEEKLLTPFKYKGGCYALPLTVSYSMLFVRNDIFDKLELSIPQTWQDVYKTAAVLQRNHLEMGIPSHVGMFFTLLYQNGGSLFDENLKTTLSEQNALDAFELWTSFFSKYSFPLSYDFFNRFRSGQMPIGIADYTLYAQLKAAAPEIKGQWTMYQMPGIRMSDGTVNRSVCISSATGTTSNLGLAQALSTCVIFKACKDKEEAFNFVKWFTGTKVQASYGIGIEAELGYTGRYTPANIETLKMLPWTKTELSSLLSAREQVVLLPEYPGNYYIAREVNNAFRSVINEQVNPVDMLSRKNVKINTELERKHKQYGITAEEAVQ